MSTSLQDKKIVVTGGFGILGRSVGALLLERGARVALVDRAPVPRALSDSRNLLCLGDTDLSALSEPHSAFDAVATRLGGIDGLVNVAGGFQWETIERGNISTWDLLYDLNVRTAVLSCQAALPHLLAAGGGAIVNISALASVKAGAGMGAYAASKAGVIRLTEALADEFKDRSITVNAVLPSIIDTPANRADMPDADVSRWVSPGALAAVIAFLLSGDAGAISGACLPVAGRV
jgi:NAD(P)-dependent dehydrogenase (short-subunit alcohol dehydrogenase family)